MNFLQVLKQKMSSKLSNQAHQPTIQSDTDESSTDVATDLGNPQQNAQAADEHEQLADESSKKLTVEGVTASVFSQLKSVWNQGENKVKGVLSASNPVETIEKIEESVEEGVVKIKEEALDPGAGKAASIFETMKETLSQGVDKLKNTVSSSSDDKTDAFEENVDENQIIEAVDAVISTKGETEESSNLMAAASSVFGRLTSTLSKGVDTIKDTVTDIDLTGSIADSAKKILNGKDKDDLHNSRSETAIKDIEDIAYKAEAEDIRADEDVSDSETEESSNLTAVAAVTAAGSIFGLLKSTLNKGVDTIKDTASNIDLPGSVSDIAKNALSKGTDAIKDVAANLNASKTKPSSEEEVTDADTVTADSMESSVNEAVDVKEAVEETAQETADTVTRIKTEPDAALDSEIETLEEEVEIVDANAVTADSIESSANEVVDVKEAVDDTEQETADTTVIGIKTEPDVALDSEAETSEVETIDADVVVADSIESSINEAVDVKRAVDDTLVANVEISIDDRAHQTVDVDVATGIETRPDSTLNSDVITVAAAGAILPRKESTIVTAVNTFGTSFESETKTKTQATETIDLKRSAAWAVEDSAIANRSPFDENKSEEGTAVPAFDAYDQTNLGSYSEPEKKPGYGWVLPVVILSLFSAAWWLNFSPTRQLSDEVDFAVLEEATAVAQPKVNVGVQAETNSSVLLNADYEGPLSKLASVDEDIVLPEALSAEVGVVDPVLETPSKTIAEGVPLSNDIETEVDVPVDSAISGQSNDTDVEVVAMIQESVTGEPQAAVAKIQALAIELKNDSPVEAVARFLATDEQDSLPKGFVLYGLNFETASSRISKDSAQIISDLASTLEAYPSTHIRLEGHTDNRGNAEKNLVLSNIRARAVKAALVSLNLDPTRVTAVGWGDEYPIMDNGTEIGQLENRRVEIIITER